MAPAALAGSAPVAFTMATSQDTGSRTSVEPRPSSPASRMARTSGRRASPDRAKSAASDDTRPGSIPGPSRARASRPVTNGAQALWDTMASTTVGTSWTPVRPRNRWGGVVVPLGVERRALGLLVVGDGPAGEGHGAGLHVGLVVVADAQGEQLQDLAAVVLVDLLAGVLGAVEVEQGGGVGGDGQEQGAEVPQAQPSEQAELLDHAARLRLITGASTTRCPCQYQRIHSSNGRGVETIAFNHAATTALRSSRFTPDHGSGALGTPWASGSTRLSRRLATGAGASRSSSPAAGPKPARRSSHACCARSLTAPHCRISAVSSQKDDNVFGNGRSVAGNASMDVDLVAAKSTDRHAGRHPAGPATRPGGGGDPWPAGRGTPSQESPTGHSRGPSRTRGRNGPRPCGGTRSSSCR